MEWLYSLFGFKHPSRSSRVRDKLADFAIDNDIAFDEGTYSWTSSSGTRCMILDVDSTSYHLVKFSVEDHIINFVKRTALICTERYLIICLDVDKEYGKCINIPEEHMDPCPHIYVYNYLDNMNMEDLLGQLGNHVITLKNGYYGPVRKVFRCYGKNSSMTNNDETITNPLFNPRAQALFSSPPYAEGRAGSIELCPFTTIPLVLECLIDCNR